MKYKTKLKFRQATQRTRTVDLRFTKPLLYPAELEWQAPPTRFELVTWKLTVSRATAAPQGITGV